MTTPELMTRLGKLFPLLASDKPGEVTATAAAITRALKGAGLDWHDVSKWVENGPGHQVSRPSSSRSDAWNRSASEAEQRRQRQERQRREREEAERQGYRGARSTSWGEEPPDWKPSFNSAQTQGIAKRCLAADTTYLDAREMEFLNNMKEWNSWATFKQERWIRKIATKLRVTI